MMEMNQYLDMFLEESKEHLQSINDHLLVLENKPSSMDEVNEIFRSAHTLKGMAATMGFEDMAKLTHEMENVLDQVKSGKMAIRPDIMDIIFQCVDILEGMVYSISENGDGRFDVSEAVNGLRRILKGETASTQAIGDSAQNEDPIAQEEIPFDEYEMTVLKQSIESGYSALWIKTTVRNDCVLKAARAYMVYNSLESVGEIIKCIPSVEELEEEKFDKSFDLVILTHKSEEELKKIVLNVSEIDSAEIRTIDLKSEAKENKKEEHEQSLQSPKASDQSSANGNLPVTGDSTNGQKKHTTSKTIRVDIERLDVLMNLFSELVIDRGRLDQLAKELLNGPLSETVEHMNRITGDLQNIILNMRMIPVEQVFNRFPRMVRDLSRELQKNLTLQIEGAETELDRTLIDEIGDPLVHLLRNSIDHGVESPEERKKAGKPEMGTILLKAFHSGNHVFIEVKDDGRGINRAKVLKKAIEKGIVSEQQSSSLTDKQVYDLLFSAGFSTAEKLSDISGRGVGLDVVKTKIEVLGGAVSVDSVPGKGTTFLIQLPLTLSIISSMLVDVGSEIFAVPLSSIIETAVFDKGQIMRAHQQDVIDFRGKVVPLVYLDRIFQISEEFTAHKEQISVLIIRKGDKMAGLVVDSFIGQQEIVLKSLGRYLGNVFAVSGATILGNGKVALIVDCNQLIK
ncbi:two-component system chemotaxis sensor kinase CheA [Ammoniphilus resinae]|uniref:Chemotaxis protein CheA n=2 Tax=Ammoniphilus resinae TaxID=861532 RepID=A0ABS4GML8_9BACL|nr:two-component system chemotaxis sensor kinase CheA [Ammoniphilus resinae]